jgi:hypothetical protein
MQSMDNIIIEPESIKPKVKGWSDFFSWNLYRWVKNNPEYVHVFQSTWNPVYDKDRPDFKWLMIGMIDQDDESCFLGRHLPNVCCEGKPQESFAYCCHVHDVKNWKDITDEFWKRYMEIGVCAIHGDFAHKWIESGRERMCEYCGKKERKMTFIESVERWISCK